MKPHIVNAVLLAVLALSAAALGAIIFWPIKAAVPVIPLWVIFLDRGLSMNSRN